MLRNRAAKSAQVFEVLISTTRTAAMRARGGSVWNGTGGSPVCRPLRQNDRSA